MEWLHKHFHWVEGFPRPDWEEIYTIVDNDISNQDQDTLWCEIARFWIIRVKEALAEKYETYETQNFMLLTSEKEEFVTSLLQFLERSLSKIQKTLPGIADDSGFGKHVVLILDEDTKYYSYISYFYPEDGEFASSSGIYLNKGYGHFVFPHQELEYAESVAAHELCHALLSHLPIPLWLNEGIAVNIENMLIGSSRNIMDHETINEHRQFWDKETIQKFWSGESFSTPDKGCELSYNLAQFIVFSLAKDYSSFRDFVNQARFEDGGESAARATYNNSLGYLIKGLLGKGDWSPIRN